MAIFWMFYSGLLCALTNLCMRKSIEFCGSAKAFFVFQLFFTLMVTLLLHPIQEEWKSICWTLMGLGVLGGVFLGIMKLMIGKALEKGPSGLTFALVNSACVMPSLIFLIFFGDSTYTFWNGMGTMLVVIGLWWAAVSAFSCPKAKWKWGSFAAFGFLFYTFFLLVAECRVWLIHEFGYQTSYFLPMIYFAASTMHFFIFYYSEKRKPMKEEILWGIVGGILNGASMYYFILATDQVTPDQKAVLFPSFTVSLIVCCNLWGQLLYKEKVNWPANSFCLGGIVLGSVI